MQEPWGEELVGNGGSTHTCSGSAQWTGSSLWVGLHLPELEKGGDDDWLPPNWPIGSALLRTHCLLTDGIKSINQKYFKAVSNC